MGLNCKCPTSFLYDQTREFLTIILGIFTVSKTVPVPFEMLLHAIELPLELIDLIALPAEAEAEMDVPVLLVIPVQFCGNCPCIDIIGLYVTAAVLLECPLVGNDKGRHELFQPFYEHDEIEAVLIHVLDVALAEVPPVQDEPRVPIAICPGLVEHVLELRHIHDAPRILLIEQRVLVVGVIGYRIVEDWLGRLIL